MLSYIPTKPNLIFLFILLHLFFYGRFVSLSYFGLDNPNPYLRKLILMFEQRARAVYIISWPTICINQFQALSARLYCVFSLSTVLYLSCHLDLNQGWKARVRVGNIPIHLSLSPSQSKGCLAEDCVNSCLLISIATLTWEKLVLFYPLNFLTKLDCQWLCEWTLCVGVLFSPLGSDSLAPSQITPAVCWEPCCFYSN